MRVLLVLACAAGSAAAADPDYRITKVRLRPLAGREAEVVGGRVVGSLTGPTNDFEDIAAVKDKPAADGWVELTVPAAEVRAYRYVKFAARNDTRAELAEIEFFAGDRKLTGTPFGTAGAKDDPSNDPTRAFDGDLATAFRGTGTYQQYVGLDLGADSQSVAPSVSLTDGTYPTTQTVALATTTPGATIRYAIDGGQLAVYSAPVRLEKSAILRAVATKPGLADSPATLAAYRIGTPAPAGSEVASFHIGNSLTDTVNDWMKPLAASAGKAYRYHRFTIPGAPTDWLWDHPGSGFGESNFAQAFLARAPLTDIVTQPFAGHGRSVDNEARYSGQFFDLARKHSPNIRPWLYVQWPPVPWDRDPWANGKTTRDGKPVVLGPPAKTFEAAVANHVKYTELVMDAMNAARAAEIAAGKCKPVRIVPGGPALAALKTQIDSGKVPGMADFGATVFASPTDFHMTKKGAYLVSLVHYACLFGESPEGKVTAAGSGLTPEQARIFQRIAWETVTGYAHTRPAAVPPPGDK